MLGCFGVRGKRLLGWKFEDKVLELRDLRVGDLGVLVVKLEERGKVLEGGSWGDGYGVRKTGGRGENEDS